MWRAFIFLWTYMYSCLFCLHSVFCLFIHHSRIRKYGWVYFRLSISNKVIRNMYLFFFTFDLSVLNFLFVEYIFQTIFFVKKNNFVCSNLVWCWWVHGILSPNLFTDCIKFYNFFCSQTGYIWKYVCKLPFFLATWSF